jgi:hypothetical protein
MKKHDQVEPKVHQQPRHARHAVQPEIASKGHVADKAVSRKRQEYAKVVWVVVGWHSQIE